MNEIIRSLMVLSLGLALGAQEQSLVNGKKYLLQSGKLFESKPGGATWTPASELPSLLGPSQMGKSGSLHWDGSSLFRLTYSGKDRNLFVERALVSRSGKGEPRWFWQAPVRIPAQSGLLAGYGDAVLLGVRVPAESKGKPDLLRLVWKDLLSGEERVLLERPFPKVTERWAVLVGSEAHVFYAEGQACRVEMLEGKLEVLTESFWKELGLTLYAEGTEPTGEDNPFLFGAPFFDADQRIVLPVVIDVALDQEDIQRAWARMPQERRDKALALGFFPGTKKPVGWKGQVHLIAFDPSSKRWDLLPRERFQDLVIVEDVNYLTERFNDMEAAQVYVTDGGPIKVWHPPVEGRKAPELPSAPDPGKPAVASATGTAAAKVVK